MIKKKPFLIRRIMQIIMILFTRNNKVQRLLIIKGNMIEPYLGCSIVNIKKTTYGGYAKPLKTIGLKAKRNRLL
jgi:hypothetical protein